MVKKKFFLSQVLFACSFSIEFLEINSVLNDGTDL